MNRLFWLFLITALLLPCSGLADTIDITTLTSGAPTVTIHVNGGTAVFSSSITVYAEAVNIHFDNSNTNAIGYCVDLSHYVAGGTTNNLNYTIADLKDWGQPAGNPSANYPKYDLAGSAASWLIDTYSAQVMGDKIKTGALQVAVWEALYEMPPSGSSVPTFNVFAGSSQGNIWFTNSSSAAMLTDAQSYLDELQNVIGSSNFDLNNALWIQTANPSNGYTQDFAIPSPEPCTLVLTGLGLFGLAVVARRRKS